MRNPFASNQRVNSRSDKCKIVIELDIRQSRDSRLCDEIRFVLNDAVEDGYLNSYTAYYTDE